MLQSGEEANPTKEEANWLHALTPILESVSDGVIILNPQAQLSYVNQRMQELIGQPQESLIGMNFQAAVPLIFGDLATDPNLAALKADWEKWKQGRPIVGRHKLSRIKGRITPVEVQYCPINHEGFFWHSLVFREHHLELLAQITAQINSSLALGEVLHNTTVAVVDYLGLASTAIFLLNEAKTEIRMISCNAITSELELAKAVFKVGEGPPGKIVSEQKPVYVRNLRTEPSLDASIRQFHSDKSSIGYPLICKGELLGAMAFDANEVRDFSEREKSLFENITNQVAIALDNAQAVSQLEYLSITDGLTGLYNHRYFQEALEREIKRAQKQNQNLALLMIDVDKFKQYNDTFGHLEGDVLLKEMAKTLQEKVSRGDIVARYGGEEFTVILKNCSSTKAVAMAEVFRQALAEQRFNGWQVTISVGVAVFPGSPDKLSLLEHADTALYRAKEAGRNCVEVDE